MIFKKIKNPKKGSTKVTRINGLADYIREPERENGKEKCVYSFALGFLSNTPEGQKAEMIALASEAVRSSDPIRHYVLSWKEHERPTEEQVHEAVLILLNELGLSEHQVITGLHDDTENLHCHVAVNCVHPDTLKVIKPNRGFDIEAGHRAIARMEFLQGWEKEHDALYDVVNGQTIRRSRKERQDRQPTSEKQAHEQWHGEQSAERIAITDAAPIIKSAKSWLELHQALAAIGMRYERKGSGALVFVGDVPIKASNVDRSASLGAIQKRLGPFESSSQEKPNEYFSHKTKPNTRHFGQAAGDGMRNLSECRMAQPGTDKKSAGVLLVDARSGRRSTNRLRRNTDRRGNGGTGCAARPLKPNQKGWNEYIETRDTHRAQKQTAFDNLKKRHKDEWTQLLAGLKVERSDALAGNWQGKGQDRNARSSIIATQQAAEKLALREQHTAERKALQAQFRPLPPYREWRAVPAITGKIINEDTDVSRLQIADVQVKKLSTTLRQLQYEQDRCGHVVYRSNGVVLFRDEGRRLVVLDPYSDKAIAVALAVAQQKFGRQLTLTGDQEFQRRVVTVAVAQGMNITFADPELEKLQLAIKTERMRKRFVKPVSTANKWAQVRQELAPTRSSTVLAESIPLPSTKPVPVQAETTAPQARATEGALPRWHTVEEWLAMTPEYLVRNDTLLPAEGSVLYVGPDGRWVQNLGRTVAVRQPSDIPIVIGAMMRIDRDGCQQRM